MPLDKDVENILDPMLGTFGKTLEAEVSGQLTTIYTTGSAEMITWGKTKGGVPIAYEGPPISQAVSWAEKEGARLVTQMDTETKRRMAQTISDGIKNKRGVPGLSRDIRKTFTDMSKHRSELIARTETANALSQASLDRMDDMGIEGKEWITVGDADVTDECLANAAQRVIPTKQAFTSGPMAPPQHPDCRCAIAPARLAAAKAPAAPNRMPDGREADVTTVDNVNVISPKGMDTEYQQLTSKDIEAFMKEIPPEQRRVLKNIYLDDNYLEEQGKFLRNITSSYDLDDKSITFWRNSRWDIGEARTRLAGTMRHETAHALEETLPKNLMKDWKAAMKKDGFSISDYAKTDWHEDFAETVMNAWSPDKFERRVVMGGFPARAKVMQKFGIWKGV